MTSKQATADDLPTLERQRQDAEDEARRAAEAATAKRGQLESEYRTRAADAASAAADGIDPDALAAEVADAEQRLTAALASDPVFAAWTDLLAARFRRQKLVDVRNALVKQAGRGDPQTKPGGMPDRWADGESFSKDVATVAARAARDRVNAEAAEVERGVRDTATDGGRLPAPQVPSWVEQRRRSRAEYQRRETAYRVECHLRWHAERPDAPRAGDGCDGCATLGINAREVAAANR